MDIDDIAQYAEMVGYGHKTGIDLPHEAEGVVPSRRWKIQMADGYGHRFTRIPFFVEVYIP